MPELDKKYKWAGREYIVKEIIKDDVTSFGERNIILWLGGHWGFQGNGFFCSKTCGFNWALMKA